MFDVILHPTDFSPESDDAFLIACAIARDNFANLVVVHAIMPTTNFEGEPVDDLAVADTSYIRECHDQFRRMEGMAQGVPISFRLVVGYPVGSILNVAEQEDAQMIVCASDRKDHFHLSLHGSIAEGLLRQSSIPVCCVRLPAVSQKRQTREPTPVDSTGQTSPPSQQTASSTNP